MLKVDVINDQLGSVNILTVPDRHYIEDGCDFDALVSVIVAAGSLAPSCPAQVHLSSITFLISARESSVLSDWAFNVCITSLIFASSEGSRVVSPPVALTM